MPRAETAPLPGDVPSRQTRRHTTRWVAGGTGVALAGLVAAISATIGTNPSVTAAVDSPLLGKPAPSFSLVDIGTGKAISLSSLSGHIVVLNFWASWCVACIKETPDLLSFYSRQHMRGVDLLGIGFGDSVAAERTFRAHWRIRWPLLQDPTGRTSINYGIYGIPETFVISQSGMVVAKLVGPVGPRELNSVVARLRAS